MRNSVGYRILITGLSSLSWLAGELRGQAAPPTIISGRVTSDQNQPLGLANIQIAELGVSVVANADGRYTITLPSERVQGQVVVVRARAIGFKPNQKPLTLSSGAHTVDFTLITDVNRLEAVVVTGVTGATSQKNVPFAVGKVDASDMQVPAADPLSQLAGKVPGAQITSFSGRPGAQPAVLLRGPKSINAGARGQDPLYIMDGVVINGALPEFNAQDIESIEVVKGAAAATLYGSRAGNGVIQITTKRGRANGGGDGIHFRSRVEYGQGGVPGEFRLAQRNFLMMDETGKRFCVRIPGYPDCARTVDINEEALRINEQSTGPVTLDPQVFVQDLSLVSAGTKALTRGLYQINAWPKQFDAIAAAKTNGAYSTQNVDMTGRSGASSYFASISNFVQNAPFVSLDGFRRQSLRVNVDNEISERWRVALASFYSKSRTGAANVEGGDAFFWLTRVPAGIDLTQRDNLGRLFPRSNPLGAGAANVNPLYSFDAERQTNQGDRIVASASSRFAPVRWLALEGNFGIDELNTGFFKIRDRGYRLTRTVVNNGGSGGFIERYTETQRAYNGSVNATASHEFRNALQTRWNAQYLYERQAIATADQYGEGLVVAGLTNTQAATQNLRLNSTDQSITAIGALTGLNAAYRDRYIVDLLFRRDGSSLFGVNSRWANYGRASVAWRLTEEPWWFMPAWSELKARASIGTAGGRPRFDAQYEAFAIASGGLLSVGTLGNKDLKPELTTESEYGIDAELFNRVGINVTYAHASTRNQLLTVAPSVASGFSLQWQNAGTLDNATWEASLNVPIVRRHDVTWSARLNYDRNRPVITALNFPPYASCIVQASASDACQNGTQAMFLIQVGERMGTIYGDRFITNCAQLPSAFASQCGAGKEWQRNDEGLIVWVGEGNTLAEGITRNLWQAERFGCVNATTGARIEGTKGIAACQNAGGTVNAPNGVTNSWGNAILLRDSTGDPAYSALGNTLPDYRLSLAQTVTVRRLSLYALVDASVGNDVWNQGRHWSFGDFQTREQDQNGKTVETAKPVAHYWRGGLPENTVGSYGLYSTLRPNNFTTEDASYAKLREVNIGFYLGAVRGVGDWTVSAVARNLYTFTHYMGFDPEVGRPGGALGSGAINGIDAFQYPNIRTFTLSIASRF